MKLMRLTTLALLVGCLASPWVISTLVIDNRLERWFDDGDISSEYHALHAEFGSDEFLLATISGPGVLDPGNLDLMLEICETLESISGISRVSGVPILYRDLFGAEDPQELINELGRAGFYRGLFVNNDLSEIGIWMQVAPPDNPWGRRNIVSAVRGALAPLGEARFDLKLVGSPALIVALDEVSQKQARRTLPIALLASIVVLAWILRSVRAMVAPVLSALVTIMLTLSIAALLGLSMNMVTTALPPLLWVLALSNAVFIVQRYQRVREDRHAAASSTGDEVEASIRIALTETRRPCILAAITTAAGFISLTTSGMGPVREFGLLAAGGILLSLIVNLSLVPVMLQTLKVPGRERRKTDGHPHVAPLWTRRPRLIVATALLLIAGGVYGLRFITVESNPIEFLPDHHQTTRAYQSFSGEIGGFYSLEVVLAPPGIDWYSPQALVVLDSVASQLEASPIVTRVVSPLDVLKLLNYWDHGFDEAAYQLPDETDGARALIESADQALRSFLGNLVSKDRRTVRLTALIREMREEDFIELAATVNADLEHLPDGWNGWATGQVLELVHAQQTLVRTQLVSIAMAIVLVFGCIAVGLRSLSLTATAVIPNLVPLLSAFLAMALLRIPLNAGTVMVASIALGIAVDNTVHVLEHTRRSWRGGLAMDAAVKKTLNEIYPAMVTTTASACAGFLALCISDFSPIRSFGFLATLAMIAALIADAVILPALLVVRS